MIFQTINSKHLTLFIYVFVSDRSPFKTRDKAGFPDILAAPDLGGSPKGPGPGPPT